MNKFIFTTLILARFLLAAYFIRIAYLMDDSFTLQMILIIGAIIIGSLGSSYKDKQPENKTNDQEANHNRNS